MRVCLYVYIHMDDVTALVMWSRFNKPDLTGRELSTVGIPDLTVAPVLVH